MVSNVYLSFHPSDYCISSLCYILPPAGLTVNRHSLLIAYLVWLDVKCEARALMCSLFTHQGPGNFSSTVFPFFVEILRYQHSACKTETRWLWEKQSNYFE